MTSPLQQKLKVTGPVTVTANRLADGVSIWITPEGGWTQAVSEAAVVSTAEAALALLARAQAQPQIAVGPYVAPVSLDAQGLPGPGNLRERIRIEGPTIALPGAV